MSRFINMVKYGEVVMNNNTFVFEHQTLFDRKRYKQIINDFPMKSLAKPSNG